METIPRPTKRGKNDWTEWNDGEWHLATGGVDFDSTAASYGQTLRKWCKAHGFKVELITKDARSKTGTVRFWIYPDPDPAAVALRQPKIPDPATARAAAADAVARFRPAPAEADAAVRLRPVPPDAA